MDRRFEKGDLVHIKGISDYVRVSELKKQAVDKLIENCDHSQVLDYLWVSDVNHITYMWL